MKIRILTKYKVTEIPDGECFWEETKKGQTVEITNPFSGRQLEDFYADWSKFVHRIFSQTCSVEEFFEKINTKQKLLKSILFGKNEIPTNLKIHFVVDPEFSFLPLEILKQKDQFAFQGTWFRRSIRVGVFSETQLSKRKNFFLVCNPYLSELQASVKEECEHLLGIFPESTRVLNQGNFTKVRFLEELSTAHYIHYSGHTTKQGIPLPGSENPLSEEIKNLDLKHVELIFMNSCYSAFDSVGLSSLTTCFLKAGAKNTIGFLNPIETDLAKKIGIQFWKECLKTKNVKKSFQKIQKSLWEGNPKEIMAGISLVHFSLEPPRSLNLVMVFGFIAICLFSLFWLYPKPSHQMGIPTETQTTVPIGSQKKEAKPLIPKSSLEGKISTLRITEFRKKAEIFLQEDHPFLDREERETILWNLLNQEAEEEQMFYEFKLKSGL